MTDEDRPELTPAHNHGKIDQVDLQSEMQRSYLDYAMSVIIGRALPRRARRAEARPPPCDLRHVRRRLPPRQVVLEVRPRRRRGHGSVPPARRHPDLRRPRPARPAVVAALPARTGPGQLRLPRQPGRRRPAVHRDEDGPARARDGARHRRRHRRLPGQLRRPDAGAVGPAGALPEPAGQRLGRHRGRHGDQHPAAQPARGLGRRAVGAREPRRHARRAARGAHGAHPRARTSPPTRRSSAPAASRTPTAPAAARSRCAPWSTSKRSRAARAS